MWASLPMQPQRFCKWPLALAATSYVFRLGHAWSSQGGVSTSSCSIIHEISHTASNIRSASDNKLHPGISTARKFPATISGTKWKTLWERDSEAAWNRLISRTLSVRDAKCKLHRHLFTVFGRSSGLSHTPVGSVNGETGSNLSQGTDFRWVPPR